MRDREEHEDRDEDKTDQSESEEEDEDNVYMDDSAPPVETPYIKNSTEELGQVCLVLLSEWILSKQVPQCLLAAVVEFSFTFSETERPV